MGLTVMTFKFDDDFPTFNFQGCLGYYHIENISKHRTKASNIMIASTALQVSLVVFHCGSHFYYYNKLKILLDQLKVKISNLSYNSNSTVTVNGTLALALRLASGQMPMIL